LRQKARLLAAISLVMLAFVVVNIAKNLWFEPPQVVARIAVNLVIGGAALACIRYLLRGRLKAAGNGLVLAVVLDVHVALLLVGSVVKPVHPLAVGIQLLAFDFVFLLSAILFASRNVAAAVFAVVMAGQVGFHMFLLRNADPGPSFRSSTDTLLRDGLLAMALFYCLAISMIKLIETAHQRSEESLQKSKIAHENLERLEQETRSVSERRREYLEIQRDFVSMVSHEFRTPLTAIQGSQFLLEKLLSETPGLDEAVIEKARKWLDLQASGTRTLNKLVDQVLVLNRIEHMTSEAALEALQPGPVLEETIGRFNDSMQVSRVRLLNELPPEFTAFIDPGLIKAAAENLISNGLKYSGLEKPVQVRLYEERPGWSMEVADQGNGIPLEDQEKIFTPFFRAGNVGTIPGTGLGLAIVQRTVAFHGGRVEFRSREGAGTTFTLHFPNAARAPLGADALSLVPPL
jgi:signal transduction histidine kinase